MLAARKNRASRKNGCSFGQKSALEKGLFVSLTIAIFIIIGLLAVFLSKTGDVCTSSGCAEAATKLLEFVDQSLDPCEDFYSFICGNYLANAYRNNVSSPFRKIVADFENELERFVVEPIKDDDIHATVLQKQFFQTCIDEGAIDADNNTKFLELLDDVGGWPVLKGQQWDEGGFHWVDMKSNLIRVGLTDRTFIRISIYDDEISNKTIPKILSVESSTMLVETDREALLTFIYNAALGLGAVGDPYMEISELVDFIFKLQKINKSYLMEGEDIIMTVREMDMLCPQIPWLKLLQSLPIGNVTNNSKVVFNIIVYCGELDKLLYATSKRVQANYIIWTVILEHVDFLSNGMRKLKDDFQRDIYNVDPKPRHIVCYRAATSLFHHVREAVYIRKVTTLEVRKQLKDMIEYIKEELVAILLRINWIDKHIRDYIVQKLKSINSIVGFTDELYDNKKINNILGVADLYYSSNNIISMHQENYQNTYDRYYAKFYKNYTKNYDEVFKNAAKEYVFFSTSTNTIDRHPPSRLRTCTSAPLLARKVAFSGNGRCNLKHQEVFDYDLLFWVLINVIRNVILVVPAPTLQDIFFKNEFPKFMNYGSIGNIIVREIIRGLYRTFLGKMYDVHSTINWNNETKAVFEKKIMCLIQQYEQFEPKQKVNGIVDLDELIYDTFGVEATYEAYKKWANTNGLEKLLPGLKYTPHQIYWLQASTFNCNKKLSRVAFDMEESYERAIPAYRVNAAFRNIRSFARDFNCLNGLHLNSNGKCHITT